MPKDPPAFHTTAPHPACVQKSEARAGKADGIMDSTLEPNMELVAPQSITGVDVINDLCDRIAQKLSKSCDLRESDAYTGLRRQSHNRPATAGRLPSRSKHRGRDRQYRSPATSEQITVDSATQIADEVRARARLQPPSLERSETPGATVAAEAAPQRRQYVSRIRGAKQYHDTSP